MIEKFINGQQYTNVDKAVTYNELTAVDTYVEQYRNLDCVKFIPASGAATRMFQNLYKYMQDGSDNDFIATFFGNLQNFAFYNDLYTSLVDYDFGDDSYGNRVKLLDFLLSEGLGYGKLPKALLKVHSNGDERLTPIDEHIYEAGQYLGYDKKKLHFTISKEHENLFCEFISKYKDSDLDITYSFQKKSTDTLAVNSDNTPFLLNNGETLYRPGGHGALIENLNDIDADIIFIKNIDNVCHKDYVDTTIEWKKRLASVGFSIKSKIDCYLKSIEDGKCDLDEAYEFIESSLKIKFKTDINLDTAKEILNRPFRVCGMVKNQGEPGGGPFVVDNGEYTDLQICEKSELDLEDSKVKDILDSAGYFNPVDLVCFVKDHNGNKYDLTKFVNEDRYFISNKSYEGRELKALELPGLWNGAMHNWNTVFVEVPEITFNPIKTVNDLLKKGHCSVK